MSEQQYKTADGSIWEASRTEFNGGSAFNLVFSPDGLEHDNNRSLSLNEVIRSWGAISFYDPVEEERTAILQSLHASGLVGADMNQVKNFQVQLVNRGYAVMPEDE